MKTCKTCGTEKEKDDFCKKSRECKECHNKRTPEGEKNV
jgi:uncharacterized protein (DUF983 family)